MPEQIENRMVVDSQWEDIEKEIPFWERVYCRCDCGREIYANEEYWNINGVIYCQDCIKEHIEDYLSEFRKVAE